MKNLLLIVGLLIIGLHAQAGIDKGNGGSGSESKLVGQQAQLESVALKLRSFFLKNEAELKPLFPEFNIQVLAKKIKMSDIRVVNENKLIDKHGKDRTCLNFSNSSLIECKSSEIELLLNQPTAIFVLVLHEYLGLIGVEETSPNNPAMVDGYRISKRIAAYVTKVNDYDLVIPKKVEKEDKALTDWPETLDAANSLSKCFEISNGLYNDRLSQRTALELEVLEMEISPGSDKTRILEMKSKILGLSSSLIIMAKHAEAGRRYNPENANEKFKSLSNYCAIYGVKLIRE